MKNRKRLVSVLAGVMAAIMLLSLILSLIPTRVSAASSSEIKKQIAQLKEDKKELESQMKDVQKQTEENEDEIANMVNQKDAIDQEIFLMYEQIENINQQLSAYALLIADKQDELDVAQAHLTALSEKNKERIRAMEEDGEITYWSVLFKASDFSDLLDRLSMIEEIAAADRKRLEEMDAAAAEVVAARNVLEAEKRELESVKDELDAAQAVLDEKRAEADALLVELVEKGYELEDLYAEMEQQEEDFLKEIAQKEKEYNEAKRQEYIQYMSTYVTVPPATQAGSSGGTTSSSGGSSTVVGSSTWLRPCSYTKVSSPFGNRDAPTAGASTNHQGVDLSAPEGTPIYASRTGIVTAATSSKSAGFYVSINHGDGFSSIYMHMTRYVVSKGQAVSAGQVIGYVGSTGISTGNHLHFGISYNGTYVNPANYVNLY
ncbi:MAG: peptidoglycan DD-metalloendopeptidase family protein [Oscillospiraceae bacterium]|nr:peptidoglycan DD-metalloendopeptidase family protein [Oscillospiraceae bacterium]